MTARNPEKSIRCEPCDITINDPSLLSGHLQSKRHLKYACNNNNNKDNDCETSLKYINYSSPFACNVCKIHFYSEKYYSKHLTRQTHLLKIVDSKSNCEKHSEMDNEFVGESSSPVDPEDTKECPRSKSSPDSTANDDGIITINNCSNLKHLELAINFGTVDNGSVSSDSYISNGNGGTDVTNNRSVIMYDNPDVSPGIMEYPGYVYQQHDYVYGGNALLLNTSIPNYCSLPVSYPCEASNRVTPVCINYDALYHPYLPPLLPTDCCGNYDDKMFSYYPHRPTDLFVVIRNDDWLVNTEAVTGIGDNALQVVVPPSSTGHYHHALASQHSINVDEGNNTTVVEQVTKDTSDIENSEQHKFQQIKIDRVSHRDYNSVNCAGDVINNTASSSDNTTSGNNLTGFTNRNSEEINSPECSSDDKSNKLDRFANNNKVADDVFDHSIICRWSKDDDKQRDIITDYENYPSKNLTKQKHKKIDKSIDDYDAREQFLCSRSVVESVSQKPPLRMYRTRLFVNSNRQSFKRSR